MKLRELTGFKSHPIYKLAQQSHSVYDFEEKIINSTEYNKYRLGGGLYAAVLAKPNSDIVYKIFESYDSTYLKYLKFIRQNQNNPHVPKIIGKPILLDFSKRQGTKEEPVKAYLIKLEKLEPLEFNNKQHKRFFSIITKLFTAIDTQHLMRSTEYIDKIEEKYPDLVDLVDQLNVITNSEPDFHDQNIMFRKDGTPVITDI